MSKEQRSTNEPYRVWHYAADPDDKYRILFYQDDDHECQDFVTIALTKDRAERVCNILNAQWQEDHAA